MTITKYPDYSPTGFSEIIFKERYAFTSEESWSDACKRVAHQAAVVEAPEKQKLYEERFTTVLQKNLFCPGGRIWYNSGRNNPQLQNCFVLSSDLDSKEGWGNIAREMIVTSMTGGGCVDADTEYFNGYGWKKISDYNGELVGQYNLDTNELELVVPNNFIKIPEQSLTRFKTKYGLDQCLCDDHTVIYENGSTGNIETKRFKEFKDWHNTTVKGANAKFLTTFKTNRKGINLTEWQLRLMVAFFADGTFYNRPTAGIIKCSKPRKFQRLIWLLNKAKIEYKEHNYVGTPYNVSFELPYSSKTYTDYFYEASVDQLKIIYEEIFYWDGCKSQELFSTSKKNEADYIQYVAHALGIRATLNKDSRAEKINYSLSFTANRTKPTLCSDRKNKPVMESFRTRDGFKYCFNVPSHALVLRRNNKIFVTGNCGIDFSDVRPNGGEIFGTRGECPGPVSLMELIDNCAEPVRAGGSRRVALMFSLDLDHPDIHEFLDAKLTKGKLTHANVSVRSKKTTEFIQAVINKEDIEVSWKGKYKKTINAAELWDKIVTNAYNSAEPGFLNWELVEQENTISYLTKLDCVNPCGEIAMSSYDACCLGHLVLFRFVQGKDVDWASLADTIRTGVRFLDNILSVNTYPLQEMKDVTSKLRRIGLGVTGLADTLALLGLQYGSEDSNKFVDKLFKFIMKQAYEASIMLAVEKGMFPSCDPKKHTETGFGRKLPHKIKSLLLEHGIRNCAILTIAPTGTVSILSGNCSSGIEPMFAPAYERRFWSGKERQIELVFHPLFKQFMEDEKSVDHFIGSRNLDVSDHLEVQKIIQRYVDNGISKTINIPQNFSIEEMSELWLEYLPYLKGTTFYRENTRGYVDEDGKVLPPPLTALSLEEAQFRFNQKEFSYEVMEDDNCKSGVCEI